MCTRDPRWENVYARVGLVEGYLSEFYEDPLNWYEIMIEVRHDGKVWYSKQQLHKNDLADLYTTKGNFDWLMDKMIQMIDYYMDGKRTD